MLGFVVVLICTLAAAVGLEASSPGTLAAVIHATVAVTHTVNGHIDSQLCDQFVRLGRSVAGCPVV